jgi:two-component system LytT family response regulator/two-component system response regulator LytT
MTISALIIDDEQLARDELKYLLDQVGGVDVVAQGTNGIEAVDLIEEHHPDLVFLDVQMPGLDGFAVIQQLMARNRQKASHGEPADFDPMPQIVFATAYDQYAVRAFDVNAVDYLLKPFDRTRVQQAVDRVRGRMNGGGAGTGGARPESQIDALLKLLNRPQGTPRTPQQTFEGQSKCRTLEELLDLLDPALFWRAHRGFVVNINHIREVVPWFKSTYQLRMNDKKQTEIPVSRAQTRRLRELFNL